jgi:UDP-GlcNAc:undecaprenyl-phosphate/decaprenyl-phosphate GlcNAc-1-phosphate transferase
MLSKLAPFLIAFVLSAALVPLCRRLALRLGRVAHPRADRWHDGRPVALLGGIAISLSLFTTASGYGLIEARPVLVGCALLAFLTGLVDDVTRLKASTKLIVQIALASTLLFFGYRINWVGSITLDSLLTLVWVVGITNAFNLLDNMDGLCGGVSMIAIVGLLFEAAQRGSASAPEGTYLLALLGAIGGFLLYNVHPASIFMGDAGSLLIGSSFGALTLTTDRHVGARSNLLPVVAAPVLVLLIPILDTTLVTLSRWFSGRPASQGGRDHSSHRLVAMGLSEPRAVTMLWALAAAGAVIGIMLMRVNQTWPLFAAVAFVFGMVLFAVFLGGIRVYDDGELAANQRPLTPLVVDMMYKRRVAEVLLDFCLITASYYMAYRLRFEDPEEFLLNFTNFSQSLPVIVASQLVAFFIVGVYRGVWRYFSITDTIVMARGVFVGVVTSQLAILYLYRFTSYSRAVFVIDAVLLMGSMTLSRASFRLVGDFLNRQREAGARVVVYGAGDGGTLAIRELQKRAKALRIVGFIDDASHKTGTRVLGYPVLGGFERLQRLIDTGSVDMVVIGARTIDPERIRNLRLACASRGVALTRLTVGIEDMIVPFAATASRGGPGAG